MTSPAPLPLEPAAAPTLWIMAGETSGDGYGASLAQAIHAREPRLVLRGMGGVRMREAGVDTFVDSTELGIIGFWECLKHIFFFLKLLKRITRLAAQERPRTVVLIDYPGFHMMLAKRLHALGIRVVWYVSPQVWAWRSGRVWKLARYCDRMLCIFPFEPACYAKTSLRAEFVGHPLFHILAPYRKSRSQREENLVLLLPGSRRQELQRLLPSFLQAAARLHHARPELRFHIPLPRKAILDYAQELAQKEQEAPEVTWSVGDTREWMTRASAALAASGTVTVEAAMLGLPVVVAYRISPFSWWVASKLIQISTITIANLVCERTVFQEVLQKACTGENLCHALEDILPGGERRQQTLEGMEEFTRRLGAAGEDVSDNVARIALESASSSPARP
ncbi:MAG: lipid-A-disaccharide synthase [Oligosphaeraceae bacterium]